MTECFAVRFRSGFRYALRWLPCVRWSASDAHGFWGFMSVRNASLGVEQQTRCSYALVGSPATNAGTVTCIPLRDRARPTVNTATTASVHSQRRRSSDAAAAVAASGQVRDARRALNSTSRQKTSATSALNEFQYKYSNGRFDSC